jgi:hypothetical protein
MYILFMYVRMTINNYLASPQKHTQNMLSPHIINTRTHTHTAYYYLMLSTLNARFPTNNVAPSGALHPFGDFPLYGNASMGTLSPKGTRVNLSALVMIAPSLHDKRGIHRNFSYFMLNVCYNIFSMYNLSYFMLNVCYSMYNLSYFMLNVCYNIFSMYYLSYFMLNVCYNIFSMYNLSYFMLNVCYNIFSMYYLSYFMLNVCYNIFSMYDLSYSVSSLSFYMYNW